MRVALVFALLAPLGACAPHVPDPRNVAFLQAYEALPGSQQIRCIGDIGCNRSLRSANFDVYGTACITPSCGGGGYGGSSVVVVAPY